MVMCAGETITVDDLPLDFRNNVTQNNKLNLEVYIGTWLSKFTNGSLCSDKFMHLCHTTGK